MSGTVVFIPAWNEQDNLPAALDELAAELPDVDVLVVDDGSTDGSSQLARRIAAEHPDRVRYLDHTGHRTLGMSASRNAGVQAAGGRYIAYLDGDDRWMPEKLESQVALMAEHRRARIIYGPLTRWYSWTGQPEDQDRDDLYGIHGDGYTLSTDRLFEPPELVALMVRHRDLVPSGALFERDLFLDVGGAEDEFTDSHEDAVVFVKMCMVAPAYCGTRSWYLYRQYPGDLRAERRAGRPDADRPRGPEGRRRFLDWVLEYYRTNGIDDPALLRALRVAEHQLEHRFRYRIHRAIERARSRVTVERGDAGRTVGVGSEAGRGR